MPEITAAQYIEFIGRIGGYGQWKAQNYRSCCLWTSCRYLSMEWWSRWGYWTVGPEQANTLGIVITAILKSYRGLPQQSTWPSYEWYKETHAHSLESEERRVPWIVFDGSWIHFNANLWHSSQNDQCQPLPCKASFAKLLFIQFNSLIAYICQDAVRCICNPGTSQYFWIPSCTWKKKMVR